MREKILELKEGLELWYVTVDELQEQDLNARVMDKQMFERLVQNIKKENRLESLPFCALKGDEIQIISGHHRTRALREAGITDLHIIIDTTGLPKDAIKAKQLAHNSIQGEDDEQILKQIYSQIEDADYKLEAYIGEEYDINIEKVKVDDININTNYETILVTFLDTQKAIFEEVADNIIKDHEKMYIAEMKVMDKFVKAIEKTQKNYDIRSMGTVFTKMAEIVQKYLGKDIDEEMIAFKDILGVSYAEREFEEKLDKLVKQYKNTSNVTKTKRWEVLQEIINEKLGD